MKNYFKYIYFEKFIKILPIFFIFWPLFILDFSSVKEIVINKRQLTTYLSKSANFHNLDKYCPLMAYNLEENFIGSYPFEKNFSDDQISELYWIQTGGKYSPKHCISRNKVSVLIPAKDRDHQLKIIIPYLHSFISPQLVEYKIFVATTVNDGFFNKGALYNSAFIEINKLEHFDCFIFHDIDLLPENQFNLYSCSNIPRHLSIKVNSLRYILPYSKLFGGVFSLLTENYKQINGFSNRFFGWGGEDDDFYERINFYNFSLLRTPDLGTYTMLPFNEQAKNINRHKLLKNSIKNIKIDGLNNVKYKLISFKEKLLYTKIEIKLL